MVSRIQGGARNDSKDSKIKEIIHQFTLDEYWISPFLSKNGPFSDVVEPEKWPLFHGRKVVATLKRRDGCHMSLAFKVAASKKPSRD